MYIYPRVLYKILCTLVLIFTAGIRPYDIITILFKLMGAPFHFLVGTMPTAGKSSLDEILQVEAKTVTYLKEDC